MSRRILIVDSVCTNRILSRSDLASARLTVATCTSAATAKARINADPPDLILVGLGPGQPDPSFIAGLRSEPATRGIPVIGLGHNLAEPARLAALRAGAVDVFDRPAPSALLVARIRSLLRGRDTLSDLRPGDEMRRALGFAEDDEPWQGAGARRARVTIVSGRAGRVQPPLDRIAASYGPGVRLRSDGAETAVPGEPDLVILDGAGGARDLPLAISAAGQGRCLGSGAVFRQIADLRADPASRHAAIMVVVPPGATDLAVMALDLGASDIVTPEISDAELDHRVQSLLQRKQVEDRLRDRVRDGLQAAVTDPLTGLHNRRFAMPVLNRMALDAAAAGEDFAVMVLDIDHFKRVNDTYGHSVGDMVLREVGARLRGVLRPGSLLARIGGEEFLVAVPRTGEEAASALAERLRRALAELPIPLPADADEPALKAVGFPAASGPRSASRGAVQVTVSVGVTVSRVEESRGEFQREGTGASAGDRLYVRADSALYAAKKAGRDRVSMLTASAAA